MCGIVCYLGNRPSLPILLNGLRRLEYRGYDSSGVAVAVNEEIRCRKAVGKISDLAGLLGDQRWKGWAASHTLVGPRTGFPLPKTLTRTATAGTASSWCTTESSRTIGGCGRNFGKRGTGSALPPIPRSWAHLIEEYYRGDLEDAVNSALQRVDGTYGIGVISAGNPSQIVVARLGSPLILGIRDREIFAASDAAALMSHTREVAYLHDGEWRC